MRKKVQNVLWSAALTAMVISNISYAKINHKHFENLKETKVEETKKLNPVQIETFQNGLKEEFSTASNINSNQELEKKKRETKKEEKWQKGYIIHKNGVKIRTKPDKNENHVIGRIYFNKIVKYKQYNDTFVTIKYKGKIRYINKKYVSKKENPYIEKGVSGDSRKSYMDYRTIDVYTSSQYKLQTKAYTNNYGIRCVNHRYCIAVGSFYSNQVGQYVDVVLANGTVLPCVIGDCKRDCDTEGMAGMNGVDGGAVEFIVQDEALHPDVRLHGTLTALEKFESPVVAIRVFRVNGL